MFKKILLLCLSIVKCVWVFAQDKPQYTQYIFNNYLLNPALSGIENYIDAKVGHRMQWTGINNAPKTTFISANWNLSSEEYLWSNPLSMPETDDNPMSKSYMQYYTASPSHHGMGLMAMSDKSGALSRIDVGLTYAYHLRLNNDYNLSVGVYGGLSRISLDLGSLNLETNSDPALTTVIPTQYKPDIAIGTWFYGARFFAGASIQQVLPQKLSFTNNAAYGSPIRPIVFVTSGYKLYLDEDLSFIPSFMLRKGFDLPLSFDLNGKIAYKEKLWIGASYRKSDSFSAMVGFNLKNFVNFTYAYDFTVSDLKPISGGTHEIVLGFQLGKAYRLFASRNNWF